MLHMSTISVVASLLGGMVIFLKKLTFFVVYLILRLNYLYALTLIVYVNAPLFIQTVKCVIRGALPIQLLITNIQKNS